MTKDQLKRAKELEALIRYHAFQAGDLKSKANELEANISKKNLSGEKEYVLASEIVGMKPKEKADLGDTKFWTWEAVRISNGSSVGIGSANIRPKALVSYLRTEAQYHYQEAKKYGRELDRL